MAAGLVSLVAIGSAGPVHASTIEVFPGANAISNAIASANAGDTIKLHAGKYFDPVMIAKRVKLVKFGDGPVILKGNCTTDTAMIDIRANNVTVKGLTVKGAAFYAITVAGYDNARIKSNRVLNTCGAGPEYGVNVFDSEGTEVTGNVATGWQDAGIYIGGIASGTDPVLVSGNTVKDSNRRGIIIEDSSGFRVDVNTNTVRDNNTAGIWLNNADETLVSENTVRNNGAEGISISSTSDRNKFTGNVISGHTLDINNGNGGTDNCFTNNTYTTSDGPVNTFCF